MIYVCSQLMMSCFCLEGEEAEDRLHLLTWTDEQWAIVNGVTLTQAKNKDVVNFDLTDNLNW